MAVSNSPTRSLQARQWAECSEFTIHDQIKNVNKNHSITRSKEKLKMAKTASIIGAAVGRVEGADKVSGQATYGADVHFPRRAVGQDFAQSVSPCADSKVSILPKRGKLRRESDRHRQRRTRALSGQKHSRYSGALLG
jgi:hypothetical protein